MYITEEAFNILGMTDESNCETSNSDSDLGHEPKEKVTAYLEDEDVPTK